MITTTQCDHDNGEKTLAGQPTKQLSGICKKCGVDLDKTWYENWLRDLELRIQKIEGFLNL